MKWSTGLAACMLLVGFHAAPRVGAQEATERTKLREEDLNYLLRELPKRHKNAFFHRTRDQFDRDAARLRKELRTLPDYLVEMHFMRLVASLGDGHTLLVPNFADKHAIPLAFYWFKDGIHVTSVGNKQYEQALGAKVVAIGDLPVADFSEAITPFLAHDNPAGLKSRLCRWMSFSEFLVAAGAWKKPESGTMTFEKAGKKFQLSLQSQHRSKSKPLKWQSAQKKQPLYAQKNGLAFWNDWLADSKTVYFKYNRCQDFVGFGKLVNGTKGFIDKNDVQRFVLDLRDNGGGSSFIFLPLYSYLATHKKLNQKGRLFVIIGRRTYSSAVLNAMHMKRTKAIFVGEPTGGKPNHFGEVRFFELPHSKLRVNYSTNYFRQIKDADPLSLAPDIMIEPTFRDWQQGKDPVLARILLENPD